MGIVGLGAFGGGGLGTVFLMVVDGGWGSHFRWLYLGGIRSQNGETQLDVDVKIQVMPC